LPIRPLIDSGRVYAFPAVWAAVFAMGVGVRQPVPTVDASSFLSFSVNSAQAAPPTQSPFFALASQPPSLTFVRHDLEAEETTQGGAREASGSHGRFAAPVNAVRRQVQLRAINPRTADELAGFFREVSYTLTDIRSGEAVPPIKVERVPDDLVTKEGPTRKLLFITALLPVILEVNQRVLAEREQLIFLRSKMGTPAGLTPTERMWIEQLAGRYDAQSDKLDELLRRVDIVPPSMAIAQSGVESGWGTSTAARTANSLFGMVSAGRPLPFINVGEAASAYVANLNMHPAYAAFRSERAAMRDRGEPLDGYRLVGTLLRYSELGQQYVGFIRGVMRDDKLTDFDKAKLSSY
jgi:Bax protein